VTAVHGPLLGEPNAPCRSCGAPLAADQRYCLQCGARRAEARLPFLDILAQQTRAVPDVAAAAETTVVRAGRLGTWLRGTSTNAAAVAGAACLLLALGVGVLIGGLGDSGAATAGAPQIITVGGAAVAPALPSTSAPATTGTTGAGDGATVNSTKKDKASSKGANATGASSATSKATKKVLKGLDSSSGGDYAKKSQKLPKTLGTGGAPPPVDKSVPAGAGSDVQSIG
jgi:hypothetical protein